MDDSSTNPRGGLATSPPVPGHGTGQSAAEGPTAESPPSVALEHRKHALIIRVQTFCDAFRLVRFMGISDEQRRDASRQLLAFDKTAAEGVTAPEGATALKHPEQFIQVASGERVDALERAATEIEDLLLAFDDTIPDDTFAVRVKDKSHPRLVVTRYARLLASRPMPAGQRHDRFVWLAMYLLTIRDEDGQRVMLPKTEARAALQQIIGGIPYSGDPEEMNDAVTRLQQASARIHGLKAYGQLFEDGYFRALHRRRVELRAHLLSPNFLFASAGLAATVENRVDGWVRALEHGVRDASGEGTWRERIEGLLQQQYQAVDKTFGVERCAPAEESLASLRRAAKLESLRPVISEPPKKKARRQRRAWLSWQGGQTVALVAVALIVLGSLGSVLWTTGAVGGPEVEALDDAQLDSLSPALMRGWMYGSGEDRYLEAQIAPHEWEALDRAARNEAAEHLKAQLAAIEVSKAFVNAGTERAIEISGGTVVHVQER